MGTKKPEPTIEDLLCDPMIVTVLQHARLTPDEVRTLFRDARDRVAKASKTGEASEQWGSKVMGA